MACEKWDIGKLDKGEQNALKRCAGEMMGSDMRAVEAYYRALNFFPGNRNDPKYFAAMCLECVWHHDEVKDRIPMEEMLHKMYHAQDTTPSTQKRIISILDIAWGEDGFLLGKLSSLVKRMRSENGSIMPDFEKLADDLIHWNSPEHYVQRRWIKIICSNNNKEEE